jgi:hypothetical protein
MKSFREATSLKGAENEASPAVIFSMSIVCNITQPSISDDPSKAEQESLSWRIHEKMTTSVFLFVARNLKQTINRKENQLPTVPSEVWNGSQSG